MVVEKDLKDPLEQERGRGEKRQSIKKKGKGDELNRETESRGKKIVTEKE